MFSRKVEFQYRKKRKQVTSNIMWQMLYRLEDVRGTMKKTYTELFTRDHWAMPF